MISLPHTNQSQADSLLRQILSSTKEAVVAEDFDGRLIAINPRFLDMIGWTQSYTDQSLDTLIAAWAANASCPTLLEDYFRDCRAGRPSHTPYELHPAAGQVIEARCLVVDGESPFRLWFFQEWRTSALAWVSHEIKNPLNAVLGFSELLTEALGSGEQRDVVASSLRGLKIGARHLQAVLGDLLDLSRLESGVVESRPEWVDLREFLSDLDSLYRARHQRRGLEFVVEAPQGIACELWIDSGRLTQILGNLISNSLRFTKRGWVAVRVVQDSHGWAFSVEDSGVGIPTDQQKVIFEPFIQTHGQEKRLGGSGLGLAICRRLAQSMGANLTVQSELGHGSRFTLSVEGLKSRPVKPPSATNGDTPSMTMLVADDEQSNFLIVQAFLRGASINVVPAFDGLQAVELWKTKRPQVILMDLRMPGLSGLDAARRIRALDPKGSTKLLAMSATKPSQAEMSEGRGLWSGFIEKPFRKQEILNFLSKYLTVIDDSAKSS